MIMNVEFLKSAGFSQLVIAQFEKHSSNIINLGEIISLREKEQEEKLKHRQKEVNLEN